MITRFHANVNGGSNVISGIGTDIQQCDEGVGHNTDGTLSPLMDEIKGDSSLNKEAGIASIISTSNRVATSIGPSLSKPKATWTRMNRMDFGLSGFTMALNLPTLGKRDSASGGIVSLDYEQENLGVKRGKVDREENFNVDESAGWRATLAKSDEASKLELPRA